MDFEAALKYLDSFVSYERRVRINLEKDFDLQRVRDFLPSYHVDYSKLDFVHVAGSKGKGTVCSLVAQYLWKAGYNAGLFTSPHVLTIRERFWVNGQMISEGEFAGLVTHFKNFVTSKASSGGVKLPNLTYFEVLTVLALKWFSELGLDFAVMEVGLGGRLDATNVITSKLSVITMIEKEHADVLGPTLEAILNEKLGIVKDGVPVVIGPQHRQILSLIRRKLQGREGVCFVDDFWPVAGGDAKMMNGRTAFAALKILVPIVDEDLFAEVLADLKMIGRFDVREIDGRHVVFDVAHTVNSIKNLAEVLKKKFPGKKYVFVIALMSGKEIRPILYVVFNVADKVYFADAHRERGIPPVELVKEASAKVPSTALSENFDPPVPDSTVRSKFSCRLVSGTFAEASGVAGGEVMESFEEVLGDTQTDRVIVVTGSTFLVGKIMKELGFRL